MRLLRPLAVAVVVALLGLLVWDVTQSGGSKVAKKVDEGQVVAAPKLVLPYHDRDGSFDLAAQRGKVVVVNFWASWCEPCKSEAPRFQEAHKRYGDRVAFVGVDTADYSADAGRFLDRYGVTYPNVRDPDRSVLGKYGGLPIPRTFVIAPNWQVTGYIFGEARSEELDSAIQKALAA